MTAIQSFFRRMLAAMRARRATRATDYYNAYERRQVAMSREQNLTTAAIYFKWSTLQ
ncbi:hypothetical protein ACH6CV_07985 [Bacillota bacterium Meth-B3]|nr:hypothetical protein [Christensenellaceae bacterium]MEA5064453.1 hypothetical protein [Eubacteriales bacterium]MEA5068660.1 hypothetical protein [Christensenellaceae bacterium]